jgi:hypothetical protein
MFQKPAHTYQGIVGSLALSASDFIDLSVFMKDKKFENIEGDQKSKMIKNTLDEAIKTRSRQIKKSNSTI